MYQRYFVCDFSKEFFIDVSSRVLRVSRPLLGLFAFCLYFIFYSASSSAAVRLYSPCGEPDLSQRSEGGVFVWKDCDDPDDNNWKLRIVGDQSFDGARFLGSITSFNDPNNPLNAEGVRLENHDSLDTSNVNDIRFTVRVWGENTDGVDLTSIPSSGACLNLEGASDGLLYVGAGLSAVQAPFDLNTGGQCSNSESIAVTVCGEPDIDPDTQTGPWLWRDCSVPNGAWELRIAGGGDSAQIAGSVSSDGPITDVVNVSVENSDVVDNISANLVGFEFETVNRSSDGMQLKTAQGSNSCIDFYGIDPAQLKLGSSQASAPHLPLNMETLGACRPEPADDALSFLIIMTDDQRFDTTWIMNELEERLLAKSVVFENAFSTSPLCCPARASLLSGGFFPYNTRITQVVGDNGGERNFRGEQDRDTIATALQGIGYKTAYTGGKYLNDYRSPYVPPGWDFFVNNNSGPSSGRWFDYDVTIGAGGATSGIGAVEPVSQYVTNYHRDQLVGFLDGLDDDDAFLAFYSVFAPHRTATPHPDDDVPGIVVDGVDIDTYEYRGRSVNEIDLSDKPDWIANPNRFLSAKNSGAPDDDEYVRDQLRSLLSVDRAIGEIVDKIESLDRMDRTVIVFMSDNGYMWGEHSVWNKGTAYDESVGIPLSVYLPGVTPRTESKIVSANLDLGATIFDLAGLNNPSEGKSLVPLLEDPTVEWRDRLQFQGWGHHEGANGSWSAVRTEQWKYIVNARGEAELYDLSFDEYEENSLHDDPNFQAQLTELAEQVENERGLGPIVFRTPDADLGETYSFQIEAWGGTQPYNWEVVTGELPPGLSLNSETGLISGEPTRRGTYVFKLLLTDSSDNPKFGGPQTYFAPGRTGSTEDNVYTLVVE